MRILIYGELFYLEESSTVTPVKSDNISSFVLINQGGFFRPDYQARMIFADGKEFVFPVSKQVWKSISRIMSLRGWQTVYAGLFLRTGGNTSAIINPRADKFIGPVVGINLLELSSFRYWEVSQKEFFKIKELSLSAAGKTTEETDPNLELLFSDEEAKNDKIEGS